MTHLSRDGLLHVAADHKLLILPNGKVSAYSQDVTAVARVLVDAGLLVKADGRRLLVPTDLGAAEYTGPGRCASCGEWPGPVWQGETSDGRGDRYSCTSPTCCNDWTEPKP